MRTTRATMAGIRWPAEDAEVGRGQTTQGLEVMLMSMVLLSLQQVVSGFWFCVLDATGI